MISWPLKSICYGERVLKNVGQFGWLAGARYTNLRTVKTFRRIGFLDIDWRNYCFESHQAAATRFRPFLTVARDIFSESEIGRVKLEAERLLALSEYVILVPKFESDRRLRSLLFDERVILGYSAPSNYGKTELCPSLFEGLVHVLGGTPRLQREIASQCHVVSIDNNSITVAARYGKYFNGEKQVFHPKVGVFHDDCIYASLQGVNRLWESYAPNCANETLSKFGQAYAEFVSSIE